MPPIVLSFLKIIIVFTMAISSPISMKQITQIHFSSCSDRCGNQLLGLHDQKRQMSWLNCYFCIHSTHIQHKQIHRALGTAVSAKGSLNITIKLGALAEKSWHIILKSSMTSPQKGWAGEMYSFIVSPYLAMLLLL